jgi:hypothetical protein
VGDKKREEMRVVVTYMSTDHESGLTYWTHGGRERVLESKKIGDS